MTRRRFKSFPLLLLTLVTLSACSADIESWLGVDEDSSSDPSGVNEADSAPSTDPARADGLPDGMQITVERVVDGDSLEVLVGTEEIELRLEGYNAPELYVDGKDGAPDRLTCNGTAAKDELAALVDSATVVTLVASDTDRYGRTLGDLIIDGRFVVEELIAEGIGLATGDSNQRRELMWGAADAEVGIWGDQCPPLQLQLRIGNVQHDPDGNDRFNLVDEWVEVVNEDASSLSLEGWILRDDTTGHRFELDGTLEPGETLLVRSGGDPAENDLNSGNPTIFLGESFPVWSNSGETVILTDPSGAFVDWRFIDPS